VQNVWSHQRKKTVYGTQAALDKNILQEVTTKAQMNSLAC
jgi:hypothetical protein